MTDKAEPRTIRFRYCHNCVQTLKVGPEWAEHQSLGHAVEILDLVERFRRSGPGSETQWSTAWRNSDVAP